MVTTVATVATAAAAATTTAATAATAAATAATTTAAAATTTKLIAATITIIMTIITIIGPNDRHGPQHRGVPPKGQLGRNVPQIALLERNKSENKSKTNKNRSTGG